MHTIAAPRGLVGPTWGANPKLRLCQKILAVSNHPDQWPTRASNAQNPKNSRSIYWTPYKA